MRERERVRDRERERESKTLQRTNFKNVTVDVSKYMILEQ